MNQKSTLVKLRKFTNSDRPFGNTEGKDSFRKLSDFVEGKHGVNVIGISFDGITATDASFARDSVVSLAKQLRGERGFYLTDLTNRDLIDNWSYAAKAKDQPLTIWAGDDFEIIGPDLTPSTRALVEYVLRKGDAFTAQVAADLGISVPNASTRLKTLVTQGYLLRLEEGAASGGYEYKYQAIRSF